MKPSKIISYDPFITETPPPAQFDGCRVLVTEQARKLIPLAMHYIQDVEESRGARTRNRTTDAQKNLEESVEAILAEVVYQYVLDPDQETTLSVRAEKVSTKSRYKPRYMGKTFLQALDLLADPVASLIVQEKGYVNPFGGHNVATSLTAGRRLVETIHFVGLVPTDFSRDWRRTETIILRGEPKGRYTWRQAGDPVEYDDTETTLRYREDLGTINDWLWSADITCSDPKADPQLRSLRRIFNESWQQGGRMYGAFWIAMGKNERTKHLRIQGEPTVSLDFAQFNPRAAYGLLGLEPTFDDAYNVPSWERTPVRRANAKILMNQLLAASSIPSKPPKEDWDPKDTLPYIAVRDQLMAFHEPLAKLFGTAVALRLAFLESTVMVSCLLQLKSQGVVGLPVHDCLIVPASAAQAATELMLTEARKVTGLTIPVKVE